MRVNRWWRFDKWLPVMWAMPRLIRCLLSDRSLGLLGMENYFRLFPLTTCMVSYWTSFEAVDRFAKDPSLPHAKAWADFNRRVGLDGSVGVWHETYKVSHQRLEAVYVNMPPFGLGRAFGMEPVNQATQTASQRIGSASDSDPNPKR